MTAETHRLTIEAQLAQQAINTMIATCANDRAEMDKLREEFTSLKSQHDALKAKYEPAPTPEEPPKT